MPASLDGGNLKVAIQSGATPAITGFSTATLQGGGLPASLDGGNLKVAIQSGATAAITGFSLEATQGEIKTLLTNANIDHAANEQLLTTIDSKLGDIDTVVDSILVKAAPVKTHQVLFNGTSIGGAGSATSASIDVRNVKHIAFFGQDDSSSNCEIIWLACATSGGTYNAFHYSTSASGILNSVAAGHTLPIFNDIPYSFIKVKINNGGSTANFDMTAALSS